MNIRFVGGEFDGKYYVGNMPENYRDGDTLRLPEEALKPELLQRVEHYPGSRSKMLKLYTFKIVKVYEKLGNFGIPRCTSIELHALN